jgi:hypothetical protein
MFRSGRQTRATVTFRADLLSEVEKELDDILAGAGEQLSEARREAIKDEFVTYTKHILDAISTEELQSASAYERFLQTTLAQARLRMRGG